MIFLLASILAILLAIVGIFAAPRGTFRSYWRRPSESALFQPHRRRILRGYLAAIGALILQSELMKFFGADLSNDLAESLSAGVLSWAWAFLIACLIAPFFEEILFRGYLIEVFLRMGRAVLAPVAAVVLFGFSHPHFLGAAVMGLVFLYLRAVSQSLWLSIAVHAAFNAISLSLIALSLGVLQGAASPNSAVQSADGWEQTVVALGMGLFLIFFAWSDIAVMWRQILAWSATRALKVRELKAKSRIRSEEKAHSRRRLDHSPRILS